MMIRRPSSSLFRVVYAAALAAGAVLGAYSTAEAQAQPRAAASQRPTPKPKDKLLVEANEMVYDKDNDTVTASGNAQLYYGGRVLEADKVTYNRKTKRVFAEGNARITEANGTRFFGDRFELTDDFKNGFIDSLRTVSPDKQRFSGARGERIDGETSVFERGTYTPCEPCKDNPSKPPLWQLRAARIIHKSSEQTIYYENATLEFWGVPIAYFPVFSSPDPTVTRKSGWLAPRIINKKALGYGVSMPYFWNVAPNMDLLLTPTYLSRQGFLGQAEFRHRMVTGSYTIRAAGIFQEDSSAFLPAPLGAAGREFRGSLETSGQFYINEKWKWGWDLAFATDKYFFNNYKIKSESFANNYFRESVSQIYLNGQGDRSWFDARAYYFRPLTSYDWQKHQPVVHPVIDYDRRFSNSFIGGEFQLSANLTSLSREAAHFQALPTGTALGNFQSPALFTGFTKPDKKGKYYYYSLFETCYNFTRGNCILRGMAGDYTRGSLLMSWRRNFIDPIGQVWTPFASLQGDAMFVGLNNSQYVNNPANVTVYGNDKQRFFISDATDFSGRVMPTAGITYKFPLVAFQSGMSHEIAPIAQLIARPNEARIGKMPNEDAQSLVFDDTTLFSSNKFSGYDRTEGGMRANYGFQYTATASNGASINALIGQSYHLSGQNSFARPDTINTGLNSGLDTRRSDYIGRVAFSPISNFTISARGRFDEKSLALRRMEVSANANIGPVSLTSIYARVAPQPMLGYNLRREGLMNMAHLRLPNNWYVSGMVMMDLDRYLQDRSFSQAFPVQYPTYNKNPFRITSTSLSVGYRDECTDLSFSWSRSVDDLVVTGNVKTGNTWMFRLELKHLGQTQYRTSSGTASSIEPGQGL